MNEFIAIARRHWKPVAALNVVIMAIALFNAQSIEKKWAASAKLILPNSTADLNLDLGTLGDLEGGEGLIFSQQIDSRQILASIMESDDSVRRVWAQDPQKDLYPTLIKYRDLFSVKPDNASTIISLSAEGSSQDIARDRLSLFINAFQERLTELRDDDVSQRSEFIQKDLVEAQETLKLAGQRLAEFQEQSNLVISDNQAAELVKAINTLSLKQGEVLAQFQANQARLSNLSARLNQTPYQAILALRLSEDKGYQTIKTKLSQLDIELLEAQTLFTDEHPQVQYLLAQRDELSRQQSNYILEVTGEIGGVDPSVGQNYASLIQDMILAESDTHALQQQALTLQSHLEQLSYRLRQLPAAQTRLADLQRNYNIAEGVYNGLVAQIQANRLNAFSTYPSVQILDQPAFHSKPVGPGRKPIALGALLASVFGSAAITLFLEGRDPLLFTKDLTLPKIGQIPALSSKAVLDNAQLGITLEFQQLALAISKMPLRHQRLLMTSPLDGEGKTTVTRGLAIALNVLGFRVLMIDGDIFNQALSQRLGVTDADRSNKEITLHPISHYLDLLRLNLDEDKAKKFFVQNEFSKYLDDLQKKEQYDYLLIDSLPISTCSETAAMLSSIHNVLLVLWPQKSLKNSFYHSLEILNQHNIKTSGLILNGTVGPVETNGMMTFPEKEGI